MNRTWGFHPNPNDSELSDICDGTLDARAAEQRVTSAVSPNSVHRLGSMAGGGDEHSRLRRLTEAQ